MLRQEEFLKTAKTFNYVSLKKTLESIELESGSLAFTFCQVPIIYRIGYGDSIHIVNADNSVTDCNGLILNREISQSIFKRLGLVEIIIVTVNKSILK